MAQTPIWRRVKVALAVLIPLALGLAYFGWYKFFREEPEEVFQNEEMRFKYGSLGAEGTRGIPYWIWLTLPRIFPEYLPGPGGYRSLGVVWEPGRELPVGFAKKTVGFPRITNNCAVCHTATYRTRPDELPQFVVGGPSHTSNIQGMLRFLSRCAEDSRFNPDVILGEIDLAYKLSWIDRMLYRLLIIPMTRKALLDQEHKFDWMNRPGWTDWGPGRDDPMNLTKYFMTDMPIDNTTGNADFPSIWNLKIRQGHLLNWSGDTPAVRSVLIDSALGLGAPAGAPFLKRMEELEAFLNTLPPPKYPFPVDEALASRGKAVYLAHCAGCHDPGGDKVGKVIDIAEIGTDRERMDTWTQAAADKANEKVKELGINRPNMVKNNGYLSPPLDGLWLRAPYLHNGSVPTLKDLLEPPDKRTTLFYRGYDVYDASEMGFQSQGPEASQNGARFDTRLRGNGKGGHLYGTNLSADEKKALLEYLKLQ
jgi:hypothetical protein